MPIQILRRSCSARAIFSPIRCLSSCRPDRPARSPGSSAERGLDKSGIKLVGPGDIVDDDDLPSTGDTLLGVVTAGIYSAAHPSQLNKDYVDAYQKATGHRANFISVGGYDGMHLIYAGAGKDRRQDRCRRRRRRR